MALVIRTTADLAGYIDLLKATTESYQSLLNAMTKDGITEIGLHDNTAVADLQRLHVWSMGLDAAYRRHKAAMAGKARHKHDAEKKNNSKSRK